MRNCLDAMSIGWTEKVGRVLGQRMICRAEEEVRGQSQRGAFGGREVPSGGKTGREVVVVQTEDSV